MHALNRKLLRDIWHVRGQALAIALVLACGIGTYVMSSGMLHSLNQTRLAYYQNYRFADISAMLKRAPLSLADELTSLPGVRRLQTRIQAPAIIDLAHVSEPITARLHSFDPRAKQSLNDLVLKQGRMLDPLAPDEVLVLEAFAQAHQLSAGDTLSVILNGYRQTLQIVGIVLSPEYVYAITPGEIVPDPARFGVLWLNRELLARAFDLQGAFNEVLISQTRDSDTRALIRNLDKRLKPYGGPGALRRSEQISDQFLSNEMTQLRTMGNVIPPVFLLVAGFLLHVVLSRLIDTQREQIGLLKAFGYHSHDVALHFLGMTLIIAFFGAILGLAMGASLGRGMAVLYMEYFKFPFLTFDMPPSTLASGLAASLGLAVLATLSSIQRIVNLAPAVAMTPPAPVDYRVNGRNVDASNWLRRFDQPSRMILRHLRRWPRRAALTVLGIASAMGLLVGASFSLDASRYMVDISFNVIDRQDLSVTFHEPRSEQALFELQRRDGVLHAEAWRSVPATFSNGLAQRRQVIMGLDPGATLSRVVNHQLQAVELPATGLAISQKLAELLNLRVGDQVLVEVHEGNRPELYIPITKVVESFMGTTAVMRRDHLNALLLSDRSLSGVHLMIDFDALPSLYRELKHTPAVAGLAMPFEAQKTFNKLMSESLGSFVFFNSLFAGLIVFGVVYNSARVSLSERGRELASLRVLGLTRAEVSWILLGELAILTLIALPLGAVLGYALAWLFVHSLDTDLFRIPLIINPATYGYAMIVTILAAVVSGLLVRRRIDHLDLIAVLKTRE